MPQKKEIDNKALIKAVESGMSRREIMVQFGFKIPGQVTTYYLEALVEAGRAKGIVGRQPKVKSDKALKVNKRGSFVIPREMVEELGYKVGDTFSISKTLVGMSLKRA
jgi:hypothetical protein